MQARTPGTLLAQTAAPTPLPTQIATPRSPSPPPRPWRKRDDEAGEVVGRDQGLGAEVDDVVTTGAGSRAAMSSFKPNPP